MHLPMVKKQAIAFRGKTMKKGEPPSSSTRGWRLLVAGQIRRIISGLDFREPIHADDMALSDAVLERVPSDVFGDLAIPECPF